MKRPGSGLGPTFGGLPMLFFLALPLVALVRHAPASVAITLAASEAKDAIWVSLRSTAASLILTLVAGTPLAVALARGRFPGRRFVGALVEAPLVLPPAAAGIGLLLALGRTGLLPTQLPFSFGAVVLAQTFVAAPLYIRSASAALEHVHRDLEEAAALDGATSGLVLRYISFPLVRSSLISGGVLAWARSLGEFGATILFAGNLPGLTQTMPLAIYLGLESDLDQAVGLSVILLVIALVVLIVVRVVERSAPDSS